MSIFDSSSKNAKKTTATAKTPAATAPAGPPPLPPKTAAATSATPPAAAATPASSPTQIESPLDRLQLLKQNAIQQALTRLSTISTQTASGSQSLQTQISNSTQSLQTQSQSLSNTNDLKIKRNGVTMDPTAATLAWKVVDDDSSAPLAGLTVVISISGDTSKTYQAVSDSYGNVTFRLTKEQLGNDGKTVALSITVKNSAGKTLLEKTDKITATLGILDQSSIVVPTSADMLTARQAAADALENYNTNVSILAQAQSDVRQTSSTMSQALSFDSQQTASLQTLLTAASKPVSKS